MTNSQKKKKLQEQSHIKRILIKRITTNIYEGDNGVDIEETIIESFPKGGEKNVIGFK